MDPREGSAAPSNGAATAAAGATSEAGTPSGASNSQTPGLPTIVRNASPKPPSRVNSESVAKAAPQQMENGIGSNLSIAMGNTSKVSRAHSARALSPGAAAVGPASAGSEASQPSLDLDAMAAHNDNNGDEEEDLLNSGLFNIETSAAFRYLQSLKENESVPLAKIEELRKRHQAVYEYLLSAFEYEKNMLKKAKILQADVARQKLEMDKTGSKVYDDNAEIGELKRELLRCQNEVVLAQEREEKYAKEIEEALITKESLLEDIEEIRRHKTDMLEPQLVANTKEIKLDLMQRKHQADNLEKDLDEKEQMRDNIQKDKERLLVELEKQEDSLAKANEMPSKIMKQAEVLRDGIASLVIENVKQGHLSLQLDKDSDKLAKKRKELEDEKAGLMGEFDRRKDEMQARERECDAIFREHELAKEQLEVQEAEKVKLRMAVKHIEQQTKADHEALIRCNREKEHLVKHYRKLENVVNGVTASLDPAKQKNHDMKLMLDVTERDAKHYRQAARDLRKECDILVHSIIEGERVSTADKELLQQRLEANRAIEADVERLCQEVEALDRDITQVKYDREMRAREVLRTETKHRKVRDDLARREMEAQDAHKKAQEAQNRLSEFSTMYDSVKTERNRYVNMIASSQQCAMELKEKSRILRSEVEVLRSEIALKDKELAKKRQENNAAYSKRDNMKMEANRLLVQYREKRGLIDEQAGRIDTHSNSLASCANELTELKSRYGQVVTERNSAGLQYLERNDELCMLYEKNNIQERAMKNGEEELVRVEERICELTRLKQELDRNVTVKRKRLPKVRAMAAEYDALRAQVKEAKLQVLELSKVMETPTEDRVRDLKGSDPSEEQLAAKVRRLELRLAQQEEKIMEKDLVLEEVSHLTERLRTQTFSGRNESAEVLGRMNKTSRKLASLSRNMMALVAELAGVQVLSVALENEVVAKRALLDKVRQALDESAPGPPVPDLEAEWASIEARRERRIEVTKQSKQRANGIAQEGDWTLLSDHDRPTYMLPTGVKTTADPRPNAYLPALPEALPVPKPYGAHAPFKPSDALMAAQSGGNLKYYRKPAPMALEL